MRAVRILLILLVALGAGASASEAGAQAITAADLLEHLRHLQDVGEANGNRGEGFGGDVVTEDYIVERLRAAGWNVTATRVEFPWPGQHAFPIVGRLDQRDLMTLAYSGAGAFVARVQPLRSGCRRRDFRGFPRRRIALTLGGDCPFRTRALNAQRAGARAILINSGDDGIPPYGTLRGPGVTIPALLVRDPVARRFARRRPRIRMMVDAFIETPGAGQIIVAELPGTEGGRVVMAGGHLDSVPLGPGVNDNASGIAALLEIAERAAAAPRPRQTLRLGFWPAEELNLYGSQAYVASLSPEERRRFVGYVNLDMIGSPNGVPEVYGGDARIEQALRRLLPGAGRVSVEAGSDHLPFLAAGIPVGGLYTGGPELKTRAQARRGEDGRGTRAIPATTASATTSTTSTPTWRRGWRTWRWARWRSWRARPRRAARAGDRTGRPAASPGSRPGPRRG
ncbi:MAG TPA: M20/M25/M40 family metallo-hydrolase [Solirubrobacteraceae bacterium]|jgi:aminopeptidase Y